MQTQALESPSKSDISEALKEGDIPENASEMTILLLAYLREKEIQKLYIKSQKKITSSTARNILNHLSKQKIQHQDVLKSFYDEFNEKHKKNISIDDVIAGYSLPISALKRQADLFDVFQLTMEMEKKCHDFFEDALDSIKNNTLARAFKFLINNEKKYLEYLVCQFCANTE